MLELDLAGVEDLQFADAYIKIQFGLYSNAAEISKPEGLAFAGQHNGAGSEDRWQALPGVGSKT